MPILFKSIKVQLNLFLAAFAVFLFVREPGLAFAAGFLWAILFTVLIEGVILFFKTKKLALNNGNSIIKTDHYMFIAKATKRELVEIYVSNVLHGFLNFERTRLPTEAVTSKTFTVMDTSEETVFLHI